MMNGALHTNFESDSEEGGSRKVSSGSKSLEEPGGDPIIVAISNFKAGFADYNANAPQGDLEASAYADRSYRPPRRVIEKWNQGARTKDGAIAALKLARDASNEDDHALVAPMIGAALSYFEGNC